MGSEMCIRDRFISAVSGDVFSLPPAARRYDIRKNMNIYFYTLLTYGLTIVISFAVVGIIVGVNKMMNKLNITDD